MAGIPSNAAATPRRTQVSGFANPMAHAGSGSLSEGLLPKSADDADFESQEIVKVHGYKQLLSSPLVAEVTYVMTSSSTILFNKLVLSSLMFPAPNSLLWFQFLVAVVLLTCANFSRKNLVAPMQWEMVKIWFPVNLIFVAMNITGFFALRSISAGMFTILKNLSNLLTIGGDWLFFGKTYGWNVWGCLFLMMSSAAFGGWTDASFSMEGYLWQAANCILTAAYSLVLSNVVGKFKSRVDGNKYSTELTMAFYNNSLSLVPLGLLILATGDYEAALAYPALTTPSFMMVAFAGGILGFGVSIASLWCMSRTSATIYSLTGSMNKVVVAVVGMWYFNEPTNMFNILSIAVGLMAGFLFVFAKQKH